jgi:2-polyprenyl-3-methyl-5-hydroxy-6-metoxy-1,4-benzoquinol methylase
MTEQDRLQWDAKYSGEGFAPHRAPGPPTVFAAYEHLFPKSGDAIDVACGRGTTAVWLAARGLTVYGVDVSPVAVRFARDLAEGSGVGDRCRFDVLDLDMGLPDGPPCDVIVCHMFRDSRLDKAVIERLAPEGLLAIAVLSEVDHGPGPFRVARGELRAAFSALTTIAEGEAGGRAWLLAKA